MFKIIKRLLIFFMLAITFLSVGTFIVINEPIVQHKIIQYVNTSFLSQNGLSLKINRMSYGIFSRTLALEGVELSDIQHPTLSHPLVSISNLGVKFNFWASYINRTIVFDSLGVVGSQLVIERDADGNLILPDALLRALNKKDTASEPFHFLKDYGEYLPTQIVITNASFQLGAQGSHNYQQVTLRQLNVMKVKKIFDDTYWLKISSHITKSDFEFPFFKTGLILDQLNVEGALYQNGRLELTSIYAKSNVLNFESKFSALLLNSFEPAQYRLTFQNTNIFADKFFSLFGIPATGNMQLTGALTGTSEKNSFDLKTNLQWENVKLSGFDIYNGQANVEFKDKTIFYTNAKITTPLGGKLFASGKFELFDEFYFENTASGNSIPLKELLDGVNAKQDVIDATLNANKIFVSGHMFKTLTAKQKNTFDLLINADLIASKFHLIAFRNEKRKPIRDIAVNLNMHVSNHGLNFTGTKAYVGNDPEKAIIEITKSQLSFLNDRTVMSMDLTGEKLDLGFLEYFLQMKTSGKLNFTGSLNFDTANPGIKFKSQLFAENGSIDNIPFKTASGNFALFQDYLEISNLKILFSDKETSSVILSYFSFQYHDLYSKIIVNMHGALGDILAVLKNRIPKVFDTFDGTIDTLSFKMSGYLLDIKTWDFTLDTHVQNLTTPKGTLSDININLHCVLQRCKQSRILLSGFVTDAHPQSPQGSSAFIALNDVSVQNSNLAFELNNVPIEFFNYSPLNFSGALYATGEFYNTWKQPGGFIDLNIDHVTVNDRDVGQMRGSYQSDDPVNPQFVFTAFNGEVMLSMKIPMGDTSKNAQVKFILNNFNIGNLISQSTDLANNLYSRLNATFSFEGKWDPTFKNELSLFKTWSGTGKIQESALQIYDYDFNVKTLKDIVFQNEMITIDKLRFFSNSLLVDLDGNYNIDTTKIFLHSNVRMNLNTINKTFPSIANAEGKINGEFGLTGTLQHPDFFGNINVRAKQLELRADSFPLTNLDGAIVFKGSIIEIQKLNANKGAGNLSLTGTFDFKNLENETFSYPAVNLRFIAQNADFKIQIPIFRFVDLALTSDLTLSGNKPPFLISGRTDIKKLFVFRDLTCSDIWAEYKALPVIERNISAVPFAKLNVNVSAIDSISIQSSCLRGRFSTIDNMTVVGSTSFPLLDGGLQTDNAILALLKARFDVKRADFIFSEEQKFDPVVNIDMRARIASYEIYWDVSGRLSTARINLTAQPQYLPNGNPITQGAILFMIATGQMPTQDNTQNLLATASGTLSYFGTNNSFSNVVDQTFSAVTGGLFDTLSIRPQTQNGQISLALVATRYYSQRLTFGIGYEGGTGISSTSASVSYFLNRNVSFLGQYSVSNYAAQTGSTIQDIFGGLRFSFGSY